MKKYAKNIVAIIIIAAIVIYFALKDDFAEIVNQLLNINVWWILFACVLMLLNLFMKALSLLPLVREFKKKYSLKRALNLIIITQFFNGVTPFATGGQPAQIYMLKKDKIDVATGTNVIFQNFIIYQLSLIFLGIVAITLNYRMGIFQNVSFLRNLVILGFFLNTLVVVVYLLISFENKFIKFIVNKIINIGTKIKIIKNKEQTIEKWNDKFSRFYNSALTLRKNKNSFWLSFIYNFLGLCFYYIIPIIAFYSVGDYTSVTILETIIATTYIMLIGSFIPTPGASGGIEYGFVTFFGTFVGGYKLTAVMLIWRFVTYYFGLFLGAIFLAFYKERED